MKSTNHEFSQLLECLFENNNNAIRLINLNKEVIKTNSEFLKYAKKIGHTDKPVYCYELFCIKTCGHGCALEQIEKNKKNIEYNFDIVINNKKEYFLFHAIPIFDNDGSLWAILEIFKNITNIQQERELLQSLIDALPMPVYYKDLEGKYLGANKPFFETFGDAYKIMIGKKPDIIDFPAISTHIESDKKLIETGQTQIYREKIKLLDNSERDIIFTKNLFFGSNGQPAGIIATITDITDQEKLKKEISLNENKYRLITENIQDIVWTVDLTLQFTYVSPSIYVLTGYTAEEYIKLPLEEKLTKESIAMVEMAFITNYQKILAGELSPDFRYIGEIECRKKDKSTVWAEIKASVIRDDKDEIIGIQGVVKDISERKANELALKKSEERFRKIFELSPEAISIISIDGTVIDCNQAALNILEIDNKSEFVGTSAFRFLKQKEQLAESYIEEILHKGHLHNLQLTYLTQQGNTKYVIASGALLTDSNNNITGIISVSIDITEQKKANEELNNYRIKLEEIVNERTKELSQSHNKFSSIIQHLKDMVLIIDRNGIVTYITPSFTTTCGFLPENILNKNAFEQVHPDDLPKIIKDFSKVIDKINKYIPTEFRFRHAAGHWIQIEAIVENMLDNPAVNGIVITARDITERKRIEQSLRESEERFRSIFYDAPIGIALADPTTCLVISNNYIQNILQYSEKELRLLSLFNIASPDNRETIKQMYDNIVNGTTNHIQGEIEFLTKSKTSVWTEFSLSGFRNDRDELKYCIVMLNNISEKKYAQEQIRLSEEKFKNIFNSASDGISITDLEGNYLEVNQMVIKQTGIPREQLLKLNIRDILKSDKRKVEVAARELHTKGQTMLESSYVNSKGKRIYLEIYSKIIQYEGKVALLNITRDISEKVLFEQRLVKAIYETEEKERNRFARDLHDGMGALLSSIKMYINLLHKAKTPEQQKDELFNKTKELISQAIETTREIANDLIPHELNRFGLVTSLKSLIDKINMVSETKFSFLSEKYNNDLPKNKKLIIYRIVNELINNTMKYAKAKNAHIELVSDSNKVSLIYSDDGIGFDVDNVVKNGEGMGINNIINRIKSIDGKCEIRSFDKNGVNFLIELKIND